MRTRILSATVAVLFAVAGCGPSIRVTTTVAPNVAFAQLHKFRTLTPPTRRDGRTLANDPMLFNSITNQALLASITNAFIARGYALDPIAADFSVAYYASGRERLDVTLWDYGYPGWWGGWYPPGPYMVTPYTEGTVIVDVVDLRTNSLLWRGRGQARTTDDPGEFQRNLADVVRAIVARFPPAVAPHVAGQ